MPQDRTEPETYSIDDVIRVPIVLHDEDGVAHVRAVFRRLRYAGELGPRGLDPNETLEFSGNGNGQQQATVEVTAKSPTSTNQETTSVSPSRSTTYRETS